MNLIKSYISTSSQLLTEFHCNYCNYRLEQNYHSEHCHTSQMPVSPDNRPPNVMFNSHSNATSSLPMLPHLHLLSGSHRAIIMIHHHPFFVW